MYQIELLQTASLDLLESYNWYEEQSMGLGDRFIKEVDNCLGTVSENPLLFSIQFSGIYRFAMLKHFPFRVVYRIDEANEIVYVSAIFHMSRDPKRF